MVIEKVIGKTERMDPDGKTVDRVVLSEHDMQRPHQRVKSENGLDIAISLQDGKTLSHGDILYEDHEKIVAVEAEEADVFIIRPEGAMEWGITCYNIGSLHQRLYLTEEEILVPYDPVIQRLLSKIGVFHTREKRRITGVTASVGAGHSHAHPWMREDRHEHGR